MLQNVTRGKLNQPTLKQPLCEIAILTWKLAKEAIGISVFLKSSNNRVPTHHNFQNGVDILLQI